MDDYVIHERPLRIEQCRIVRLANNEPRGVIHGDMLHRRQRLRTGDADIAHVADVKDANPGAHGNVLFHQAAGPHRRVRILDGHLPAAKIHHLGAQPAMYRVQRRLAQRGGSGLKGLGQEDSSDDSASVGRTLQVITRIFGRSTKRRMRVAS